MLFLFPSLIWIHVSRRVFVNLPLPVQPRNKTNRFAPFYITLVLVHFFYHSRRFLISQCDSCASSYISYDKLEYIWILHSTIFIALYTYMKY